MNDETYLGNPITRRTFVKKTALTVGSVTLLSQGIALANGGSGSSSCPYNVAANPNAGASYTTIVSWEGFGAKLAILCSPPGAPTKGKVLTMRGEGWKNGSSVVIQTNPVVVSGSIDSSCDFSGSVSPSGPDTYVGLLSDLEWDEGDDLTPQDYVRVHEWVYVYFEVTDTDSNEHHAYAKGKIYLAKVTKKSRIYFGVNTGVLAGYPTTTYSPSHELMNGWVWKS